MTAFDLAWAIVKADGTVTSGTPGTNNPMHSRPSGYESGGILDPMALPKKKRKPGKKRPIGDKRRQQEGIKPDAPRLLAENKRKLGDVIQNSTTNLLYALGLFAKSNTGSRLPPLEEIMGKLKENEEKAKKTASPYAEYYGAKQ
tara:strand:- start:2764 stop:3195 length:432 start_codon:yes stop_codon:yes gene_type:complete